VCIFEQKKNSANAMFCSFSMNFSGTHPSIPILNMLLSVMLCVHACMHRSRPVPFSPVQLRPGQRYEKQKHSNDGDSTTITTTQRISSFFFFPRKPPRSGRTFYIQQMLGLFYNAFMIIIIVRRHHTIFTSSSQKETASYPPKWPGCQSTWQDSAKQKQIWHY